MNKPGFGIRISDCRPLSLIWLACLLVLAAGCRREMYDQPYSKPLKKSDLFPDRMASRPVVANTVARGHLNDDEAFFAGKIGTNLVETFPIEVTRKVLERGRERYDIYCSPCHARTGEGNGMIVQRGFPPPPSYHIDRLREALGSVGLFLTLQLLFIRYLPIISMSESRELIAQRKEGRL